MSLQNLHAATIRFHEASSASRPLRHCQSYQHGRVLSVAIAHLTHPAAMLRGKEPKVLTG